MNESDEEFVRRHWEGAEFVRFDHDCCEIELGGELRGISAKTPKVAWSAARAFTEERLERIRQVEEEIDLLTYLADRCTTHEKAKSIALRFRAREQAALAELCKGMTAQ